MRTPLWILDFTENGRSARFFETWWKAFRENSSEPVPADDKWFYVSSCVGRKYEDILDDAGHLTLQRDGRDPLIPVFKYKGREEQKVLNVVFLGDITDEKNTIPFFHFWATKLRLALLDDETQWTTLRRVHFYGMLWRPNTAAIAPGVSAKTRGFLQELNVLMKQDVNHAPFRSISLVESPSEKKEKDAAFDKMYLATLQLSAKDFIGDNPKHRFLDLSASGVFFEASVQAQQGEFLLSSSLMEKLARSKEAAFYNATAAQEYVDADQDTLECFEPQSIVNSLKEDCPTLNSKTYAFNIEPGISPWSTKLKKVWADYYCDFIPNYKKNLVNRVKRGLKTFARDYREKLYANQKATITSLADLLQKQVFSIFTVPGASKYVGLQQAEKILAAYKQRIHDLSTGEANILPFGIPDELKGAAKQAQAENRTPEDALAVLERKLKNHPVILLSMVFRTLVLGGLLAFLAWTYLPLFLGAEAVLGCTIGAGVLPLLMGVLGQRARRIRIESLKQQYIGVMLNKCQEELRDEIVKCLQTTYNEIAEYCKWIQSNKLQFLEEHLSVLTPADFSFEESPVLQPLIKAGKAKPEGEESMVLIPPVSVEDISDEQLTGSFGRQPLLDFGNGIPMHTVNINGVDKDIQEVMKQEATMSDLVKDLMSARASIRQSIEREAAFTSKDMKGKTRLLLDVSGSMSGEKLEDLKKAVHALGDSYHVEWIAFDDKVVASSFDEGADIDSLKSGGGTNYIPALRLAVEKIQEDLYDDVILISDGCPFEPVDKILDVALQLQQPLNTISIGTGGADVMKELSEKTAGVQIVVDEVKEIVRWEGKMQAIVQLGEAGEFTFGQLLAKCHIPGCAKALRTFVRSRMRPEAVTLNSLIAGYPGQGLEEWAHVTKRSAALSHTANLQEEQYTLGIDEAAVNDEKFCKVLDRMVGAPQPIALEDPFILATLLYYRGLNLNDFAWAGLDETCADLNDRDTLKSLLPEGVMICNLFDRPIR